MLSLERAREIMRRSLDAGEDHVGAIRDTIANEIEQSADVRDLYRITADKLLSLAVAAERDENGERLAFPDRDDDGDRIIVHTEFTTAAAIVRRAGERRVQKGTRIVREGYRLIERAEQLEIRFPTSEAA